MTTIKGTPRVIAASTKDVFDFLADFRNFNELLPEQVTNWRTNGDECSFTIKGMADITLKISEAEPYKTITYTAVGKPPFPFSLDFPLVVISDKETETSAIFNGELNMMLELLAKTPLQNFCNIVTEKLQKHFEK
jgi:carbon monoxide dehydrogenase subunit G